MSSDETFVTTMLRALAENGIEAIVVGSVAAILQGAPVTTDDMDVLIRDTVRNREKIQLLEAYLGHHARLLSPTTTVLRITTPAAHLDLLFDEIAGSLKFEALRSRSRRIDLPDATATVASLADVIASKEAANRPKDRAQLPILRDTLRVLQARQG